MGKMKKYKFSNKSSSVKISFMATSDQEAIKILGSLVQNVGFFSNMRSYKLK